MSRPDPFPPSGSTKFEILKALLAGEQITPITAIVDFNCFTINARVSELRKLGWPIRTLTVPHPNPDKFPKATLPRYVLDEHFRSWAVNAPEGTHPAEYPFDEGRGKFERSKF